MKLHDIMLFIAASMSEEDIIFKLKEAVDKYQAGNKEARKEIVIISSLLIAKDMAGTTLDDIRKASTKFDEMSKFDDIMKGTS